LLINTVVGYWQENKANNSLVALRKMVKVKVKVLRNLYPVFSKFSLHHLYPHSSMGNHYWHYLCRTSDY